MSDTLQEEEDQRIAVNFCAECQGYTHVPWCSKYEESKEYQRDMFPVGTRVRAIAPISRSGLGGDIPVGAWGTVFSHCDDGRAYIFFDGYDKGHTFHQPELFIRVVCTHQNHDERCPANAPSPHEPAARGGGEWKAVRSQVASYIWRGKELVASCGNADTADQIVAERKQMIETFREIEAMLNAELGRDYESQP